MLTQYNPLFKNQIYILTERRHHQSNNAIQTNMPRSTYENELHPILNLE